MGEVAEFAFGAEVDFDVLDDDAGVHLALGVFKAPEFFAVFVGDGDGFAFPGYEGAFGAGGFDQNSEAFVRGKFGGVHIGFLEM